MQTIVRTCDVPPDVEQLAGNFGESSPWSPLRSREWLWNSRESYKVWRPPTDVYETDEEIIVRVEIAGLKEGDFEVSLRSRLLTIRGTRRETGSKLSYHRMEIQYGDFVSEVHLPYPIESMKTEATYQDGFLVVRLPKPPRRRVNVVEVK
jgi:HSP20 family protein